MTVYSVTVPGMEDEWECVAVFSTRKKAERYASGFHSWAVEEHTIDNPEADSD